MPIDTNSTLDQPSSQQWLPRTVATIWRVLSSLAALATLWTFVQLAQAVQLGGVRELLPSALVIYAAGIGYLALVSIIALQFDRAIRAGHVPGFSPLLWLAHILVVFSASTVAWRGVSARGVLVGLGASLVAWGVVAILALFTEIATRFVGNRLPARESAAASSRPSSLGSTASVCLGCVAVLGLGLAYLESRPLPNLPDKPHVSPSVEAGSGVTEEKSATREEPAAMRDS